MAYKGSYLRNGKWLEQGDYLISPNGLYTALMQGDGNFVLYHGNDPAHLQDPYWDSKTAGSKDATHPGGPYVALIENNGNFVLCYGSDPTTVTPQDVYWATNTVLGEDPYMLALQDDGNLVLSLGSDPTQGSEPCWSALPFVKVQCKFMQNYREASPVNGGKDIVTVRNSQGDIELFTIGSDGNVHNFFPDSTNELGYSEAVITSGLQVVALAGDIDHDGKIVLLIATFPNPALYYLVETSDPSARWSAPKYPNDFVLPPNTQRISNILVQTVAGMSHAVVTIRTNSGSYAVAMASWQAYPMHFTSIAVSFPEDPCCFFQGNTPQNTSLAAFLTSSDATFEPEAKILFFPTAGGQETSGKLASLIPPSSLASTLDGLGETRTFAIFNAHVCSLQNNPDQNGNAYYTWVPLWQQEPDAGMIPVFFQEVVVEADSNGLVHVFGVSTPTQLTQDQPTPFCELYHWTPDTSSATGYASPPLPIYKSSSLSLAGVGNNRGSIEVFAVNATNEVYHLFQEQVSGDWAVEAVETDPENAVIEDYSSYATEITLYDSSGATLPGVPVTLRATEQTRIVVNGGTFFLDASRSIQPVTNGSGMLSLAQETNSLASPTFQLSLPTLTSPNAPLIVIQPFVDVQDQLAKTTGVTLQDATVMDEDGNVSYLLDEEFRTDEKTTDSLAASIKETLAIVTPALLKANTPTAHTRHRFWSRSRAPIPELHRIAPRGSQRAWVLSFEGNKVRYQALTPHEAAARRAEIVASYPSIASTTTGSWWRKIGDALRSVVEGIAQVIDVVVQGVQATIRLIIEGITYVFDTIVEFIEDAFNTIELFFAQVRVFFEKLYQWLAWLFAWPDILRTKDAVAHVLDQLLEFAQESAPDIKAFVNGTFPDLEAEMPALLQQAEDAVGQATVGGYEQSNAQPDADYDTASSNNFLCNEFAIHVDSAPEPSPLQSLLKGTVTDDFVQQLMDFLNAIESTPEWQALLICFDDLGSNPDKLFSFGLSDLLEAVGEVAIQAVRLGVQMLLDSLLDIVQSTVISLRQVMTEPWNIPFVSKFYTKITGNPLTALDAISLIVAIPTTLLYKLSYQENPFPDQASLDAFKGAFNAQAMRNAYGFTAASAQLSASPQYPLDRPWRLFLASIYAISTGVGAFFSGQVDSTDPTVSASWRWKLPNYICSLFSVGSRFELIWTALETDVKESEGGINLNYLLAVTVLLGGIAVDFIDVQRFGTQAEKSDSITLLQFVIGIIFMWFSCQSAKEGSETAEKAAWRIIMSVVPLLQPARLSIVSLATGRKSLKFIGVSDFVIGLTAAILGGIALAN